MSEQQRLTVPVLLDGWQIECCGTPPAVGDSASWRLRWGPWYASAIPSNMVLMAGLERLPIPGPDAECSAGAPVNGRTEETVPTVAKVGGISVFVKAPVPLADDITLTGVLHEDHHGNIPPEIPRTTGLITGVWLVSWDLRLRGRTWRIVDGSARLDEVPRAPKRLPRESPPEPGNHWRNTIAVLVDLATAPG